MRLPICCAIRQPANQSGGCLVPQSGIARTRSARCSTLMDDRIVKATGASSGRNMHPEEEGLGHLDMEVGLFQTQRGNVVKILRSQVAHRHPHSVYYTFIRYQGLYRKRPPHRRPRLNRTLL